MKHLPDFFVQNGETIHSHEMKNAVEMEMKASMFSFKILQTF